VAARRAARGLGYFQPWRTACAGTLLPGCRYQRTVPALPILTAIPSGASAFNGEPRRSSGVRHPPNVDHIRGSMYPKASTTFCPSATCGQPRQYEHVPHGPPPGLGAPSAHGGTAAIRRHDDRAARSSPRSYRLRIRNSPPLDSPGLRSTTIDRHRAQDDVTKRRQAALSRHPAARGLGLVLASVNRDQHNFSRPRRAAAVRIRAPAPALGAGSGRRFRNCSTESLPSPRSAGAVGMAGRRSFVCARIVVLTLQACREP